jgi:tRNA-Thr(GGU) m(6)t(6)A37 methyltransferase TsaA
MRCDQESLIVENFTLQPIGRIRSLLHTLEESPRQGGEGAPEATLEVDDSFARALDGLASGDDLIVITWLHCADRALLKVHPRNDLRNPLTGVFATRSPDRPNPLGLRIGPIEAIDGTPVVDIKPVLAESEDA